MDVLVVWRFAVQLARQRIPELEADLEDLGIVHLGNLDQVAKTVEQLVAAVLLGKFGVIFQINLQEEAKILDEALNYTFLTDNYKYRGRI